MAHYDYDKLEVGLKIVYYGPGLGGKTTNLRYLHANSGSQPLKLHSIETANDRTLFFDLMPMDAPPIGGFKVRVHLYTVPGQVHYDNVRKVVLRGADAVVFVADSQKARKKANISSLKNLYDNMRFNRIDPKKTPIVVQYNKRDLADIESVEELESYLNKEKYQSFEASAITGVGVRETLAAIIKLVSARTARQIEAMQKGESATQRPKAQPPKTGGDTQPGVQAPSPKAAKPAAPPDRGKKPVPTKRATAEAPVDSAGLERIERTLAQILKRLAGVETKLTRIESSLVKRETKSKVAPEAGDGAKHR